MNAKFGSPRRSVGHFRIRFERHGNFRSFRAFLIGSRVRGFGFNLIRRPTRPGIRFFRRFEDVRRESRRGNSRACGFECRRKVRLRGNPVFRSGLLNAGSRGVPPVLENLRPLRATGFEYVRLFFFGGRGGANASARVFRNHAPESLVPRRFFHVFGIPHQDAFVDVFPEDRFLKSSRHAARTYDLIFGILRRQDFLRSRFSRNRYVGKSRSRRAFRHWYGRARHCRFGNLNGPFVRGSGFTFASGRKYGFRGFGFEEAVPQNGLENLGGRSRSLGILDRSVFLSRPASGRKVFPRLFFEDVFPFVQSGRASFENQRILAVFRRKETLRRFYVDLGKIGSREIPPFLRNRNLGRQGEAPYRAFRRFGAAVGNREIESRNRDENDGVIGFESVSIEISEPEGRFDVRNVPVRESVGGTGGFGNGENRGIRWRAAVPNRLRSGSFRLRMTCRMSRMACVPPPFLIAGRNPVISGHAIQNFQTPPLRAVRVFLRAGRYRFFGRVRVLFPLRPYRGQLVTRVRARGNFFRRTERRAFRSVLGDGDLPLFRLRQRFERAFVNRRARRFPYRARGRMSCVRADARFGARTVLGRFGIPRRRTLTQARGCRAPFVLGRENVPGARSLRPSETEIRSVTR